MGFGPRYWKLPFNVTLKVPISPQSGAQGLHSSCGQLCLVRSSGWQDSGDQQQHGLHVTQHAQQRSAVEHPRGQLQLAGRSQALLPSCKTKPQLEAWYKATYMYFHS